MGELLPDRPTGSAPFVPTNSKYERPNVTNPSFDDALIAELGNDIEEKRVVSTIVNSDRNIGTRLSGEITRRFGMSTLPPNTINLELTGTAGQSLAAFLCKGISIHVRGEANDYVGKGMAGGRVILSRFENSDHPAEMVIAGNAVLYGATGGELFAAGCVAERFCVRNSGALAIVEGCGDHGCEYMTGGSAVILGPIGNNFGAGMTGGEAFVWLENRELIESLMNQDSVMLTPPDVLQRQQLANWLSRFQELTGSSKARQILANWPNQPDQFIRILPRDSETVLASKAGMRNKTAI